MANAQRMPDDFDNGVVETSAETPPELHQLTLLETLCDPTHAGLTDEHLKGAVVTLRTMARRATLESVVPYGRRAHDLVDRQAPTAVVTWLLRHHFKWPWPLVLKHHGGPGSTEDRMEFPVFKLTGNPVLRDWLAQVAKAVDRQIAWPPVPTLEATRTIKTGAVQPLRLLTPREVVSELAAAPKAMPRPAIKPKPEQRARAQPVPVIVKLSEVMPKARRAQPKLVSAKQQAHEKARALVVQHYGLEGADALSSHQGRLEVLWLMSKMFRNLDMALVMAAKYKMGRADARARLEFVDLDYENDPVFRTRMDGWLAELRTT